MTQPQRTDPALQALWDEALKTIVKLPKEQQREMFKAMGVYDENNCVTPEWQEKLKDFF